MPWTTLLGFVIGVGGILFGSWLDGGHFSALFQLTAACIVFGGTLGATLISNRGEAFTLAIESLKNVFSGSESFERQQLAAEIIQSAQHVRRESLLSLEGRLSRVRDPFMKAIYRFAIDGADPETLQHVFQEQIAIRTDQRMSAVKVWSDAGGFAPTIGIIGAVLGLISVMTNITDTSKLGEGIAVAFVATIYGVASANLIFLPIANKLKCLIRYRAETEQMVLDGALAIVGGLSPHLIEQKLSAYAALSEAKPR